MLYVLKPLIYKVIKNHFPFAKGKQAGAKAHEAAEDIMIETGGVDGPFHTGPFFTIIAEIKANLVFII